MDPAVAAWTPPHFDAAIGPVAQHVVNGEIWRMQAPTVDLAAQGINGSGILAMA